ncbi:MAG: response regulator transcription factor [Ignavibacteriae bacterium]|nr:response regulator transcription factor [Ignavibacteriota bacterium]
MIKVAVVEDDAEIRQLLTLLIDASPGFSCKHSYNDCKTAVSELFGLDHDVILMDIILPQMSGIEGVKLLKEKIPNTDFIMLTVQEDDNSIFDSLCAGASGYLLKDTPPAELLESIKEVINGGSPMTPSIARRVIDSFKRTDESPLSKRETEILELLCDGKNYKVIADQLFVSGNTVRAHIKNIYRKLHVSSRAEAVKKAINDKLV